MQYCRGSWCYVEKRGPDGWVSANYLRSGRPSWDDDWDDDWYNPRPPRPPHWDPYPPRPPRPPHWDPWPQPIHPGNPGAQVCFNGPNGYFCIGS